MNPPGQDPASLVTLRRLTPGDAAAVERLISDRAIADTTLSIPHPYPAGGAAEWIAEKQVEFEEGRSAGFGIIGRAEGALVGCIGVRIESDQNRGEFGYWIGRPYWNRGYGTAAVRLFLDYCFCDLALRRVYAEHFTRNPASGRVLEKAGLQREGMLRQHVCKEGRYEDIVLYGLLRDEHLRA